jgi:hypothetical protein|tara:strand:+ start:865 stop:1035 length:171 start_codon:yes stop_codon:yes gene_type:complete
MTNEHMQVQIMNIIDKLKIIETKLSKVEARVLTHHDDIRSIRKHTDAIKSTLGGIN